MHATTLALVGATGGAGTTRTVVELAAIGARGGHDVAVIDAAFGTQGLSEYVRDRIGTDLTALITDDTGVSLSAATHTIVGDGAPVDRLNDLPGRVELIPARAPFERVARAKTAEAARKLERRVDEAATSYDAVVIDCSPVASNEAVAAVTVVDRVGAVRPATPHGIDALQRLRGRIADVGTTVDTSVAVRRGVDTETDAAIDDADVVLPPTDPAVAAAPTVASGSTAYAEAIVDSYARLFDTSVDIEFDNGGIFERLRN